MYTVYTIGVNTTRIPYVPYSNMLRENVLKGSRRSETLCETVPYLKHSITCLTAVTGVTVHTISLDNEFYTPGYRRLPYTRMTNECRETIFDFCHSGLRRLLTTGDQRMFSSKINTFADYLYQSKFCNFQMQRCSCSTSRICKKYGLNSMVLLYFRVVWARFVYKFCIISHYIFMSH